MEKHIRKYMFDSQCYKDYTIYLTRVSSFICLLMDLDFRISFLKGWHEEMLHSEK